MTTDISDPCFDYDLARLAGAGPGVREFAEKLKQFVTLILRPYIDDRDTAVMNALNLAIRRAIDELLTDEDSVTGARGVSIQGDNVFIERVGRLLRHINVAGGTATLAPMAADFLHTYDGEYVSRIGLDAPLHVQRAYIQKPVYVCEIADGGAHADEEYDLLEVEPDGAGGWVHVDGLHLTATNEAERTDGTHGLADGEIVHDVVRRWDAANNAWQYSFWHSVRWRYWSTMNAALGVRPIAVISSAGYVGGGGGGPGVEEVAGNKEYQRLLLGPSMDNARNVQQRYVPPGRWLSVLWRGGMTTNLSASEADTETCQLRAHVITSAWNQGTVNWAGQPTYGPIFGNAIDVETPVIVQAGADDVTGWSQAADYESFSHTYDAGYWLFGLPFYGLMFDCDYSAAMDDLLYESNLVTSPQYQWHAVLP